MRSRVPSRPSNVIDSGNRIVTNASRPPFDLHTDPPRSSWVPPLPKVIVQPIENHLTLRQFATLAPTCFPDAPGCPVEQVWHDDDEKRSHVYVRLVTMHR